MLPLICLAIVLLYFALRLRMEPAGERGALALRLATITVTAWAAENSMIRIHEFYGYSERWIVLIDKVPLLVILIWPVVIQSAVDLARQLHPHGRGWLLTTFLIVLADAWLIEPVAVQAGFWNWAEPGIFDVPLIGPAGWAVYAAAIVWALEADTLPRRLLRSLVALAATHVGVLALWYLGLRHLTAALDTASVIAVVFIGALLLAVPLFRKGRRGEASVTAVLMRGPGAAFFYVLAVMIGDVHLLAYALAFSIPYLALMTGSQSAIRVSGRRRLFGA